MQISDMFQQKRTFVIALRRQWDLEEFVVYACCEFSDLVSNVTISCYGMRERDGRGKEVSRFQACQDQLYLGTPVRDRTLASSKTHRSFLVFSANIIAQYQNVGGRHDGTRRLAATGSAESSRTLGVELCRAYGRWA